MLGKIVIVPFAIDALFCASRASYNYGANLFYNWKYGTNNTLPLAQAVSDGIVDSNIDIVSGIASGTGKLVKIGFNSFTEALDQDVTVSAHNVATTTAKVLLGNEDSAALVSATNKSDDIIDIALNKIVNDGGAFLQNNAIPLVAAGSLGLVGAYYSKQAYYTIINKSATFQAKVIPTAVALTSFVASGYLLYNMNLA